jgi:hypothetical protein
VTPTVVPAGWTGTLNVRGNGYVAMKPVTGTSGAAFHLGGPQNTNTAFVNFGSSVFGATLDNSSEISFMLKSAYSYAERKALPSSNMRSAFEIYDATGPWFCFSTYTSSVGELQFAFGARGYSGVYTVPSGTQDQVFGKDVTVKIKITWTSNSFSLWVNGTLVQTHTISVPKTPSWSSASAFTIGSRSARLAGGGYYSSDDTVAEFTIR